MTWSRITEGCKMTLDPLRTAVSMTLLSIRYSGTDSTIEPLMPELSFSIICEYLVVHKVVAAVTCGPTYTNVGFWSLILIECKAANAAAAKQRTSKNAIIRVFSFLRSSLDLISNCGDLIDRLFAYLLTAV